MEQEKWLKRWQTGETGFHQEEGSPQLKKFLKNLSQKGRFLVPLCGKSVDMRHMLDAGHEVLGIELSALAVEEFFKEQNLSFTTEEKGDFTLYQGDKVEIYQGDIFKFTSFPPKEIPFYYFDRGAMVALNPQERLLFQKVVGKILHPQKKLQALISRISYPPQALTPPPYEVSQEEFMKLFPESCHFDLFEEYQRELQSGSMATVRYYHVWRED